METTMIAGATLPAQTYMPDNDTALVQASRGGDVAAFEQLVKRYDAKLLRIAQKVTQNPEDAEEAVQEAFFKAYQKLDQFQGHAKFSTWLIRITLNESLMKLRKQRATLKQLVDNDVDADSDSERRQFDVADWAPNPEMLYRASEFREILITSLQRLSPALKVVFVLRDIEEHSLRETSEILNLTETAVKTRLSRARLQLREDLSKYFKKPE
ncbi:MAG TPA: sigma-70 family RNA polymerase sigma factor [Candidatus Acidoferrum sp.]|jgi:RNA polymerase sigma-70 factor (ECF subfamily)|nr:sigma-70 family RNA polymerase sigma factor [Candidatus Acidoferrum sp.]